MGFRLDEAARIVNHRPLHHARTDDEAGKTRFWSRLPGEGEAQFRKHVTGEAGKTQVVFIS